MIKAQKSISVSIFSRLPFSPLKAHRKKKRSENLFKNVLNYKRNLNNNNTNNKDKNS